MFGSMQHEIDSTKMQESFYSDTNRLNDVKRNKDDPESLKVVAKEFEAIFVQMMLKSMRDAQQSMKSEFFSDFGTQQYEQMYDQQLSLSLSQNGGIGLADAIVRQMSPYMAKPVEAESAPREMKPIEMESIEKVWNKNLKIKEDYLVENGKKGKDFHTKEDFVKNIWPAAVSAAEELKTDPKFIVAQAALETGWGQNVIQSDKGNSSNNYFGIKVESKWKGNKIIVPTMEFDKEVLNKVKAEFKAYPDLKQGFVDYSKTIKNNGRYKDVVAAKDVEQFATGLQSAGYATDPKYADKIISVCKGKTLNNIVKTLKLEA